MKLYEADKSVIAGIIINNIEWYKQNIPGASQQNSAAAFSWTAEEDGCLNQLKRNTRCIRAALRS